MYEICMYSIADSACSFYGQDTLGSDYNFWVATWYGYLGAWNRDRLTLKEEDHG